MTQKRKDDKVEFNRIFCTERYFSQNGTWFYYARDIKGELPFTYGPFLSKEEAIKDCEDRFINK